LHISFLFDEKKIFKKKIQDYIKQLTKILIKRKFNTFDILKDDEKQPFQKLFQNLTLKLLLKIKDEDTLKETKERFSKFLSSKEDTIEKNKIIFPEIRNDVFKYSIKYGNENDYFNLKELFLKSNDSFERNLIADSLCFLKKSKLIDEHFDFVFKSGNVKEQDLNKLIPILSYNFKTRPKLWNFFKSEFYDKFSSSPLLTYFIKGVCYGFKNKEEIEDYEKFYLEKKEKNLLFGKENSFKQSIEVCKNNFNFIQFHFNDLKNFFGIFE
jgi:hypothetical protein